VRPTYVQEWRFPDKTIKHTRFYQSDSTARAATLRSFRSAKPKQGVVVIVYRDGEEIACFYPEDVTAKRKCRRTMDVRCSFCPRQGKFNIARLIHEHPDMSISTLLRLLSVDCPRRIAARTSEPCGVHLPGLADVFGTKGAPT
jgi:hypothetical protein